MSVAEIICVLIGRSAETLRSLLQEVFFLQHMPAAGGRDLLRLWSRALFP